LITDSNCDMKHNNLCNAWSWPTYFTTRQSTTSIDSETFHERWLLGTLDIDHGQQLRFEAQ